MCGICKCALHPAAAAAVPGGPGTAQRSSDALIACTASSSMCWATSRRPGLAPHSGGWWLMVQAADPATTAAGAAVPYAAAVALPRTGHVIPGGPLYNSLPWSELLSTFPESRHL